MGLLHYSLLLLIASASLLSSFSAAASNPRKLSVVQQQPLVLNYHNGPLLKGDYIISILYYGRFTPTQRSIISDFISSLTPSTGSVRPREPSVTSWWSTTARYRNGATTIKLGKQILDENYSLGKVLKAPDVTALAGKMISSQMRTNTVAVVLTSADVAVDGFCRSKCGLHGSIRQSTTGNYAYLWVGNSATQCPGQCAWPFHQPTYGPQSPPLISPNNDVGVDGMVINVATLLAGAVTNPFGDGFFQGPATAPLEAVTACPGVFGSGAYPGFPGKTLTDSVTGASYNAYGINGRKFLLPAMWDPKTSQCATPV